MPESPAAEPHPEPSATLPPSGSGPRSAAADPTDRDIEQTRQPASRVPIPEAGGETFTFSRTPPPAASEVGATVTAGPGSRPSEAEWPAEPESPAGYPSIPGYEILGELGRGGMGVVYKARHVALNRLVALKMILAGPEEETAAVARFRLEAEAIARLHHPNIIQVFETGAHAGRPYFAMEFVPGRTLSRRDGPPPAAADAAELVEKLARAIDQAHRQYVVHRDLKPANVLLTADGEPKVTDFGLAKRLDDDAGHTVTGAVMGTPSYMAPEQAAGKTGELGPAVDIYALGAILYELLTGRPPFKGDTVLDTIEQVRQQEPVAPTRVRPQVPADLETICLKCLEKEPQKRYPTAEALAEDLRRFRAGEPIQARPVTAWERTVKWAKRRPAVAGLIGLAAVSTAVILVGGAAFTVRLRAALADTRAAWRAAEEQREADQQRIDAVRAEAQELLFRGQAAYAREDWAGAELRLASAAAKVGGEPALADLRAHAGRLLADAKARLDAEAVTREARERLKRFAALTDDALFHGTLFTGLDPLENLAATKAAARDGLALLGVAPDGSGPPALPGVYTDREKARVTAGCYDLLLVLAEAEAATAADLDPAARRDGARRALRTLDRAVTVAPATRAYHSRRARYLAELGDAAGAEAERRRAEGMTTFAAAGDAFLVGDERYKRGDLDGALAAFEESLRLQPDHFWAKYFSGVSCLKLGRPAEAKAYLTACLAGREFVWCYLLRGVAHGELGQFAAADADFAAALRLAPDEYGVYVNRGAVRIRQGRSAEAVADLTRAVALRPNQYQAYVNLARAYQHQRKFDDALRQLDRAVALRPAAAELYRDRARLHLHKQDLAAAARDFGRAVALDPQPEDHVELGRLHHRGKRHEEAVRAYDAALRRLPGYAVAHRLRGEALLGLERPREAVGAFDRYLELGQPEADVYRARGLARAKVGEYAGAVSDYTRALELDPDSANMRSRRGWAYLLSGPKLALRDFEEAVRLNPENADAYAGRGYARALVGRHAEAARDAEEAVRLAPGTAEVVYNAACVLAKAASRAAADPDLPGREAVADRYGARAVELVGKALDLLPTGSRPAFWRQAVEGEEAFESIRHRPAFASLRKRYGEARD